MVMAGSTTTGPSAMRYTLPDWSVKIRSYRAFVHVHPAESAAGTRSVTVVPDTVMFECAADHSYRTAGEPSQALIWDLPVHPVTVTGAPNSSMTGKMRLDVAPWLREMVYWRAVIRESRCLLG